MGDKMLIFFTLVYFISFILLYFSKGKERINSKFLKDLAISGVLLIVFTLLMGIVLDVGLTNNLVTVSDKWNVLIILILEFLNIFSFIYIISSKVIRIEKSNKIILIVVSYFILLFNFFLIQKISVNLKFSPELKILKGVSNVIELSFIWLCPLNVLYFINKKEVEYAQDEISKKIELDDDNALYY